MVYVLTVKESNIHTSIPYLVSQSSSSLWRRRISYIAGQHFQQAVDRKHQFDTHYRYSVERTVQRSGCGFHQRHRGSLQPDIYLISYL